VRHLALHVDGRVVVTEGKPGRVSIFNGSGAAMGVVGRNGSGPGEYGSPYATAWLGDTLAIYDVTESRVVLLTQGKSPLRTERTVRLSGSNDVRFYPVSRTKAYLMQSQRSGTTSNTIFVGFGSGKRDTVSAPPRPPIASGTMCRMGDGLAFFSWPEAPRNIAIPVRTDGAMATGNTGSYRISITAGGKAVATLARTDLVPLAVADSTWNAGMADYYAHVKQYGAASCEDTPKRPPHRAPIRALTVADNGEFWVTVQGKGEYAYNVFAPDGTLRATLVAPRTGDERIMIAVAGNRLAMVDRDVDDVQTVKLFRIVR
jgi:hypothetical protein